MKHHKKDKNGHGNGVHLVPVRFEFNDPAATTVCVAGTFNQWRPEARPLRPQGISSWISETVLAPGTYEYCLVVDGRWIPDPRVRETVPNPFGGQNSILEVGQHR